MDIRDILKSFDQLTEGESTVHKAGPGGYGNKHGSEDVTDQYGKPIGRMSLGKLGAKNEPKRGKGRPPNPDKAQSYDSSALGKAMGMGKAPKPTGKPSVKHSLKEYFSQLDDALSEAGLAVQPMPATAQQQQQKAMAAKPAFMIKDPANPNMPAITTQDPAVVQAAKNGTMSMQKPGAAPTAPGATPAAGAGSQVAPMKETGDVGKHNNATTGFDALVRKLTPKYGKEAATKIAGSQFQKMKESEIEEAAKYRDPKYKDQLYTQEPLDHTFGPDMDDAYDNDYPDDYAGRKSPMHSGTGDPLEKWHRRSAKNSINTQGKRAGLPSRDQITSLKQSIKNVHGQHARPNLPEAEQPQHFAQSSPLSTANRGVLEGKKGVNPFAKKDTKKKPDADKDGIPDYAEDGKGKNDLTKKGGAPKKGVNPFAKKTEKKKVKEGMEHHLQAARLEGKSHALRKMPYNCTHDNMEEARCYHDGFKEGLDECYGQMPILGRTRVGEVDEAYVASPSNQYDHYGDEASPEEHKAYQDEINLYKTPGAHPALASIGMGRAQDMNSRLIQTLQKRGKPVQQAFGENEVGTMASYGADDMGMDEGNAFTAGLAKTPHGSKFKVGGSTFTDKSNYDSKLEELAFEALDKQLNALLESEEKVSEGMTVSISKGQQGSPDSVSVSAQDGEADQLLSIIKSAGLGLFGGEEQGFNAPQGSAGAHGGISVVDDHDGMMALMKKLSGGGDMPSGGDYESEEGSGQEEHMHGEEETCNECGGMMEENHQCGSGQQVVDEVESEDQMAYNVAEENAPDSGADNTNADVAGNASANSALATADAGEDEEEGQVYSKPVSEDGDDEAEAETEVDDAENVAEGNANDNCKKCDCNPCKCETVAESFANLYKKLAFLSEESTDKEDEKAEKAGKKVAKDIEYDEGHKGKDDNKAEKAGKKVTKDIEYDDKKDKKKIDEWANEAGKNGTDASFETDIDFMTKVISGGLNKQKSTGQTTIPVINGQKSRMGVDGLGSPMKESTDLLKDYMKLSGL